MSRKRTLTFDRRHCRAFAAMLHVLLIKGCHFPCSMHLHAHVHTYVTRVCSMTPSPEVKSVADCRRFRGVRFANEDIERESLHRWYFLQLHFTVLYLTLTAYVPWIISSYDEILTKLWQNFSSSSRKTTFANLYKNLKLSIFSFIMRLMLI